MMQAQVLELQVDAVAFLSQCGTDFLATARLRTSQLATWKGILAKHYSRLPLMSSFGGAFLNLRYLNSVYHNLEQEGKTPLYHKLVDLFPSLTISDQDVRQMSRQSYFPQLERALGGAYQHYLREKEDNFPIVKVFLDEYNAESLCNLCRAPGCQSCRNLQNLYKYLRLSYAKKLEECLKDLCVCHPLPFLLFSFFPEKYSTQGFP